MWEFGMLELFQKAWRDCDGYLSMCEGLGGGGVTFWVRCCL